MQERFIPALFSVLQMRTGHLHPVAREAMVRSYSWYLMGAFLPDIPNEQEEQASFLRRWVLSYRDQERAWQKNLADENPHLADLALELMRSNAQVDQLGEMSAFALGAGVLTRQVWRSIVSEDTTEHLDVLLATLATDDALTTVNGNEESKLDWESFWRPIWVMQDLLRFPRIIDHVTQGCQSVFDASMSGEALARWSKLSHLRLADSLRSGRQSVVNADTDSHEKRKSEIENATMRFTILINNLAVAYWDEESTPAERFVWAKEILNKSDLEPAAFDDWKTAIHSQRVQVADRGKNPKPAFYEAPPPYPKDSVPPVIEGKEIEGTHGSNGRKDTAPEIENASDSVDTVEGLPLVVEVNTDPPTNQDTDLESQDYAAETEDAPTIDQEDDTSENESSDIEGGSSDSSEAVEEKSP